MAVIDEEGRIFGTVNVVDALVVLFALAVVVAGVALVTGGGGDTETETPTRTVVFETGTQPDYVVNSVTEGQVPTSEVVAVENKRLRPPEGNATGSRLRLTVTLVVEENGDGLPTFAGERLYVGRDLQLDLGTTIVSGTVVDMRP
jgi:hypothetical protein